MSTLTRRDLDPMGCDTPNCGHDHTVLYLTPACHSAPTRVRYDKRTGAIAVVCGKCQSLVCEIAVAS